MPTWTQRSIAMVIWYM